MEISEEMFYNIVIDWKKRNITNEEKSALLTQYMNEKNISQRELTKRLGISHSTMHDWLTNRQMKKYYATKETRIDTRNAYNTIFTLADRLNFLLSKPQKLTDNEKHKLTELKNMIEKVMV